MKYSPQEVMEYVREEDVKFIRLAFCDVFGNQKNISVMPGELPYAFEYGIPFDGSAIKGFSDESRSDLLLHPDPDTLNVLPWRPEHGKVVRMFCNITYPDGRQFESDTRAVLKNAAAEAEKQGISFSFGSEMEFYLFCLDENGKPTKTPYDNAEYMDIAPEDKGENVRREICLTLEQMGIRPESSHHEEGPGQNEIDFRHSEPMTAADNTMTFQTVVKTVAHRNGLWADFSPKPLKNFPGNGFHINISAKDEKGSRLLESVIAGILDKISEITLFLNPDEQSYKRLGSSKAPEYISWAEGNRSQLIRVPAAQGEYVRAELRSADSLSNPYLAFALIIYAGLYGIKNNLTPPPKANINLFTADEETLKALKKLPLKHEDAVICAENSDFVKQYIPQSILSAYCKKI